MMTGALFDLAFYGQSALIAPRCGSDARGSGLPGYRPDARLPRRRPKGRFGRDPDRPGAASGGASIGAAAPAGASGNRFAEGHILEDTLAVLKAMLCWAGEIWSIFRTLRKSRACLIEPRRRRWGSGRSPRRSAKRRPKPSAPVYGAQKEKASGLLLTPWKPSCPY